jgi:hypothetical protein
VAHPRRLLALVPVLGAALAIALSSGSRPAVALARQSQPIAVSATVGATSTGQAMAPGFVGVSLEFEAVHAYTGSDPHAINPVLVHLLRALAPGAAPVLRIGGNSSDQTWWPMRDTIPPLGVRYWLTPNWLATTHALVAALGARVIVGVNLAANRPALAATEARALLQGLGRRYVQAIEIGNEPDVYSQFPWYVGRGLTYYARPLDYDLGLYTQDFTRWSAAMPDVPLAGPAFAELTWLSGLSQLLAAEPKLKIVTMHRYPLRACVTNPIAPGYASIQALLADPASAGLAEQLAPYVQVAHNAGLPFRMAEMNSASCSGKRGTSDTFAAALWVLDTLFNFANVGVDGVNLHTLPGAPYELFTFTHGPHGWRAFVHPEYYGMLLFAQAFPPGAQMLPVTAPSGPVKIWATRSTTSRIRVVLINKSTSSSANVQLTVPSSGGSASLEWLRASSVSARKGITLGGQGFGTSTASGTLRRLRTTPIVASGGVYTISLPPASAVLLTQ